jgi:hypothetical protein
MKYLVRGPHRDKFPYYFVAGRGWTSTEVVVEVVDGDVEPTLDNGTDNNGTALKRLDPHKMIRTSLDEIRRDRQMVVRPIDETGGAVDEKLDIPALLKENDDLKIEVSLWKDECAVLKKQLADLGTRLVETTAVQEAAKNPTGTPVKGQKK